LWSYDSDEAHLDRDSAYTTACHMPTRKIEIYFWLHIELAVRKVIWM